jgi:hypothetical protein
MHVRSVVLSPFFVLAACYPSPGMPDGGQPDAAPVEGACPDPADKSDANLATPGVSFAHDVMPIFRPTCGIAGSICHGDPVVSGQGRPFLAYPDGGTDAAQVWPSLVGVVSAEDPKMNLVSPGNLDQSFLWQKVDNLQCNEAKDCMTGSSAYPDCGQSMPYGLGTLDQISLDTIARWIVQGAKNN